MAPNSSAFSVTSAPRSVRVETITTGMGRSRISFDQKVDAIHAGHFDIEGDDIRVQVANHFARHERVRTHQCIPCQAGG